MREAHAWLLKQPLLLYALGEIECLFGSELQIASDPSNASRISIPNKIIPPVTVTGCGIFQFVGVKVRVFGLTVPSECI